MEDISLLQITIFVALIPALRRLYFIPQHQSGAGQASTRHRTNVERNPFFDYVRGVAIIAIILIHITRFFRFDAGSSTEQLIYDVINNLSRFAIPIFFLTSGILLKPLIFSARSLKEFYLKKIKKLLIPYTLCVVAIAMFYAVDLHTFWQLWITGRASTPYWFVIVLFQMYLLYPLLQPLVRYKWFLPTIFVISLFARLTPDLWFYANIPLVLKYLYLFAIGMALRPYFLEKKNASDDAIWWILVILLYVVSVATMHDRFFNTRFFFGPAVFGLLFILKDRLVNTGKISQWTQAAGKNSLWIFLTHYFIVEFVYNLSTGYSVGTFWQFIFVTAIVVPLSVYVAHGIHRVYSRVTKKIYA